MTREEFWTATPNEFNLRLEGWREQQEAQSRERWEQTRHLAYLSLLPHLDRKKRLKITDVLAFPWDEKPKPPSQSEQLETLRQAKEKWGMKLSEKLENNLENG